VGTVPGKWKLTKAEQLGIPQVGLDWLTKWSARLALYQ